MATLVLCICTCGRPAGLERVLGAVDGLEWPEGEMPSFAVVVVDNLPDGRARAVVERLRPAFRWPLHFVEEPERGISQARNRAVAEALSLGAEFVAFVDDDDVPRPDWLWWLWQRQRETGADIVFGNWAYDLPTDTPDLVRSYAEWEQRKIPLVWPDGSTGRVATRNVLLSRHAIGMARLDSSQVFDARLGRLGGEDTDMFTRAIAAGCRYETAVDSYVMVDPPGGYMSLLRRNFWIGTNAAVREWLAGSRASRSAALRPLGSALLCVLRMLARPTRRRLAILGMSAAMNFGLAFGRVGLTVDHRIGRGSGRSGHA